MRLAKHIEVLPLLFKDNLLQKYLHILETNNIHKLLSLLYQMPIIYYRVITETYVCVKETNV